MLQPDVLRSHIGDYLKDLQQIHAYLAQQDTIPAFDGLNIYVNCLFVCGGGDGGGRPKSKGKPIKNNDNTI